MPEPDRLHDTEHQLEFARLAMAAAQEDDQNLPNEVAVVAAVKKTRAGCTASATAGNHPLIALE